MLLDLGEEVREFALDHLVAERGAVELVQRLRRVPVRRGEEARERAESNLLAGRFAVPPMAIIGMAAAPSSVAMVSVPAQRLRSVFFRGASNLLYFPENRDFY